MSGGHLAAIVMSQNETQAAAQLAELRRVYALEWFGVHGALTAIDELVKADFPMPGEGEPPTRYQVDALRALRCELCALLERG